MLSTECLEELRNDWLPHITNAGLQRLIELLEHASPLLVHGCFTKAVPMGCLATHAAWHHPRTTRLMQEAGVTWLNRVAGLNPATSLVVRAWDRSGIHDLEVRSELLSAFRQEQLRRREAKPRAQRELVEAC